MVSATLFFVCFAMPFSGPGPEAVPVITNPENVSGKTYKLELVEDLRIEPNDDLEHTLWAGANVSIDVSAKGHIFITDPMGERIVWFDEKGQLVKTFGGKGEGPGQFKNLANFQILADGSGVAVDGVTRQARFHFFDPKMEFVSKKRHDGIDRILKSAYFAPNGQQYRSLWVTVVNPDGYQINQTGILNLDREILVPLSEDRNEKFDMGKSREASYWVDLIADHLSAGVAGMGKATFGADSSMYTARSNAYEITHWSADKKKLRIIKKAYKPKFQSEDEIMAATEPLRDQIVDAIPPSFRKMVTQDIVEAAVEKANMLPRKHPIYSLMAMEDGGLLVLHDYSFLTNKGSVDIFSPEGHFLGSSEIPRINANLFYTEANRVVFRNGYAHFIELNDNNENAMVRYKYRLVPAK